MRNAFVKHYGIALLYPALYCFRVSHIYDKGLKKERERAREREGETSRLPLHKLDRPLAKLIIVVLSAHIVATEGIHHVCNYIMRWLNRRHT